jgi:cytochrome c-type biogenesis protein CcmH
MRWLVLLLVVSVGCHDGAGETRTATDVEARLFAPCCWTQTLDVHPSPIADELRAEITTRIAQGEPARTVEDDLAARYGERIRAVPREVSSASLGVPFVVALVLALGLLGVMARRLMRRSAATAEATPPAAPDDAAAQARADRLDDELLELD